MGESLGEWRAEGVIGLGQVRWDEDKGQFVPARPGYSPPVVPAPQDPRAQAAFEILSEGKRRTYRPGKSSRDYTPTLADIRPAGDSIATWVGGHPPLTIEELEMAIAAGRNGKGPAAMAVLNLFSGVQSLVDSATASFIRGPQGYSGVSTSLRGLRGPRGLEGLPELEPAVRLEGWDDDPLGD